MAPVSSKIFQRQRHPHFYYEDGSFQLRDRSGTTSILYRLSAVQLCNRSGFIRTLLSLPRDPDSPLAWSIVASSVSDEELESEAFLMSILKLSAFLDIKDGRQFALRHIPSLWTFRPVLQLAIVRMYGVDHWLEPAFKQVVRMAFISPEDFELLGANIFAYTAPDHLQGVLCHTPRTCSMAWSAEWWNGLARQVFHPDSPMSGRQILEGLDQISIPGMCEGCQNRSIAHLRESEVLLAEENHVEAGIMECKDWLGIKY